MLNSVQSCIQNSCIIENNIINNDNLTNFYFETEYWTMSAYYYYTSAAISLYSDGSLGSCGPVSNDSIFGARVVVIGYK